MSKNKDAAIKLPESLPMHADGVTLSFDELMQYKFKSSTYIKALRSSWSQINGIHKAKHKGRGLDFSEVRKYQAGDDVRSIDWRVSARVGKVHTKLFAEERDQTVILYLDLNPRLHFGSTYLLKSVQLAHFASLIVWQTLARKDRIGAIINTGKCCIEFKASSRLQHALQIFSVLIDEHNAGVQNITSHVHDLKSASNLQNQYTNESSFIDVINTLQRVSPKGGKIILLSDFVDTLEYELAEIYRLVQHNIVELVQFFDPLEYGHTNFTGSIYATSFYQGKVKASQWLNFASQKHRAMLKHNFMQHKDSLQKQCDLLGISFRSISSGEALLKQLYYKD